MRLSLPSVQTDETCGRSVHQRVQQTPGSAFSAEVPGVPDREAGQVGGEPQTDQRMSSCITFSIDCSCFYFKEKKYEHLGFKEALRKEFV